MELISILSRVELFDGLNEDELQKVAAICEKREYPTGSVITHQGEPGDELFVIWDGLVEVILRESSPSEDQPKTVVNLGQGQVFGEMALVDFGPRSATIRVISNTAVLQAIPRDAFLALCDENHRVGYIVMRNMAADLSFKLRHQHLASR
jgi:CRP-like cAMP-binding protein